MQFCGSCYMYITLFWLLSTPKFVNYFITLTYHWVWCEKVVFIFAYCYLWLVKNIFLKEHLKVLRFNFFWNRNLSYFLRECNVMLLFFMYIILLLSIVVVLLCKEGKKSKKVQFLSHRIINQCFGQRKTCQFLPFFILLFFSFLAHTVWVCVAPK